LKAVGSADHTPVAAVKAGGLVETLSEQDRLPFCTTNAAFDKLPKGTVESLLEPANLKTLQGILTTTVQVKLIANSCCRHKAGKGKAVLTTVQGGTLPHL
jgi:uncharacterized surface protein with fasciclin (FAS1) repeats